MLWTQKQFIYKNQRAILKYKKDSITLGRMGHLFHGFTLPTQGQVCDQAARTTHSPENNGQPTQW